MGYRWESGACRWYNDCGIAGCGKTIFSANAILAELTPGLFPLRRAVSRNDERDRDNKLFGRFLWFTAIYWPVVLGLLRVFIRGESKNT